MKTIKLILRVLLGVVRFAVVGIINWSIVWPLKIGALGLIIYPLVSYILFQSFDADEIQDTLVSYGIHPAFWILLGLPLFLSFVSCMGGSESTSQMNTKNLDTFLRFRDGQMNISSDKKASEIYQRTSGIDTIRNNQDSEIYKKAQRGFDAKHGMSTPQKILRDMLED